MSRVHGELAIRRVWPRFPGPIDVQLHSIAIGIAQVKRLAHTVIGSALKPDSGCDQTPQRIRQRRSSGIDDCVMVEARLCRTEAVARQGSPMCSKQCDGDNRRRKETLPGLPCAASVQSQARPDKIRWRVPDPPLSGAHGLSELEDQSVLSFRRPLGLASGLLRQSKALCLNLNIDIDQ